MLRINKEKINLDNFLLGNKSMNFYKNRENFKIEKKFIGKLNLKNLIEIENFKIIQLREYLPSYNKSLKWSIEGFKM